MLSIDVGAVSPSAWRKFWPDCRNLCPPHSFHLARGPKTVNGSTEFYRFSDESLSIRDIQFDLPTIGVVTAPFF